MALHILHEDLLNGSVRHSPFTSASWQSAVTDPTVARCYTHPPNLCIKSGQMPPIETVSTTNHSGEPIVLIDCMNILFRSHFAFKGLTTKEGAPTGVYHGFFLEVHQLISKIGWRLIFCWDGGIPGPGVARQPNWRMKILPSYKGTRKPSEDSAVVFQQIPEVVRILNLMGFPSVGIPGLEADDIIGILSSQNPDERIEIFSTDRDLYQLLSPNTRITKPGRMGNADWSRINARGVLSEYGITIEDWPKYLALGGDSSDNIKPVAGWGPETAKKLVALGADPSLAFESNPASVRESKYGDKLRENWSAIQASYIVAAIPRTMYERRIVNCTKNLKLIPLATYQGPVVPNRTQRIAEFTRFCADNELVTLLSKRREYFKES